MGYEAAIPVLKDYISYGVQWNSALGELARLGDPSLLLGLPEVICARFATGTQLLEPSPELEFVGSDGNKYLSRLWAQWSQDHPCIGQLLIKAEAFRKIKEDRDALEDMSSPPRRPDFEKLSVADILSSESPWSFIVRGNLARKKVRLEDEAILIEAFSSPYPPAWYVALLGLQALDGEKYAYLYPALFKQTVARFESLPQTRGAHRTDVKTTKRILNQLPPTLTLPLARRWFSSSSWDIETTYSELRKESFAEELLERYAVNEDIPIITAALAQHIQARPENLNSYHTCSMLDILSLFPEIGPLPQVEQVFVEADYSLARQRAAFTMQVNSPEWFAETYAYECLWDCEIGTRIIGCESVSLEHPGARQRLQELAEDQFEYGAVKDAARMRLVSV